MRPKDEKEVNLLKKKDPYGHYKLSGEEALKHYQKNKGGFPWVILRLADVIGPRDTTNRRVQGFVKGEELYLSFNLSSPFSFFYRQRTN